MPAAEPRQQVHEHVHDLRYDPTVLTHDSDGGKYLLVCIASGQCDEDFDGNWVRADAVGNNPASDDFLPCDQTTWPKYQPPEPYADRHPAVRDVMRWLLPNPGLGDRQFEIANAVWELADRMVMEIADAPQLTDGLKKLLEAKDCFVRASLSEESVFQELLSA